MVSNFHQHSEQTTFRNNTDLRVYMKFWIRCNNNFMMKLKINTDDICPVLYVFIFDACFLYLNSCIYATEYFIHCLVISCSSHALRKR